MPKIAVTHIQNMAPGPPRVIAVATPARLPVPTCPDSAVETACHGVISPSPCALRPRHSTPKAGPRRRSGRKPRRSMKNSPVPSSRMVMTPTGRMRVSPQLPPHRKLETVSTWAKKSFMKPSCGALSAHGPRVVLAGA
jgi:hypothetical protein